MVVQAGKQGIAAQKIAFVVVKHPLRNLAVPNQVMPVDEHVVLEAEGNVLIGKIKVVLVRLRDERRST